MVDLSQLCRISSRGQASGSPGVQIHPTVNLLAAGISHHASAEQPQSTICTNTPPISACSDFIEQSGAVSKLSAYWLCPPGEPEACPPILESA